jgi:hypothetical protein
VVTLTVRAPVVAVVAITQLAVKVVPVGVPLMVQVTPVPDTATAVAAARSVPVSVTGTVAPRRPVVGVMEVSDGPARVVKTTAPVVPLGVTT